MKGMFITNEYGSSINLTLTVGNYDISIAADNSCNGYDKTMRRFTIAVFRDDSNVTDYIFNENELIGGLEVYGTEDNLFKAMEYCRNNSIIEI